MGLKCLKMQFSYVTLPGVVPEISDRGAGASDRGSKMIEKGRFRALFCQISSDENQNFLRRGAVAP